jgi:DNA invertase Pin-like site-specific DNA recombinase
MTGAVAVPYLRSAVAYLRVSTEDQSNGIEAQRDAIERWAVAQGARLLAPWHEDRVSGAAPLEDRPGLGDALAAVSAHPGAWLIVAKRDRIARDVVIAATVERLVIRSGGQLASADGAGAGDGPEAALIRTILDAFSAYELAMIRLRTRAGLRAKIARGERCGAVRYGYAVAADGRTLVPDDHEQGVVRRVLELSGCGAGQRAIVRALAAEGWRARGRGWNVATVQRILREGTRGLRA